MNKGVSKPMAPLEKNVHLQLHLIQLVVVADIKGLTMKLSLLIALSWRTCLDMYALGTQRPSLLSEAFSSKGGWVGRCVFSALQSAHPHHHSFEV